MLSQLRIELQDSVVHLALYKDRSNLRNVIDALNTRSHQIEKELNRLSGINLDSETQLLELRKFYRLRQINLRMRNIVDLWT